MMLVAKPTTAIKRFLQGLFIGENRVIKSMVITAPLDAAALIKPKPSDPTFKISLAKTGSNATAPPKNTENKSKLIAPNIILLLKTKLIPSVKLFTMLSLGMEVGGWGFKKKMQISAMNIKMMITT